MIRHHHISERACGRRASHGERFIRCHAKFIPPLLILARRYSWDSRHGPVKRRTCRFSGPRNKLGAVWGPRDYSPQPNRDLMLTNRETHKTASTLHPCWLSTWIRCSFYTCQNMQTVYLFVVQHCFRAVIERVMINYSKTFIIFKLLNNFIFTWRTQLLKKVASYYIHTAL